MDNILKRRGTFKITHDLIQNNPQGVLDIIKSCLVVKAESLWAENVIIYTACCMQFDEIEPGTCPLEYKYNDKENRWIKIT